MSKPLAPIALSVAARSLPAQPSVGHKETLTVQGVPIVFTCEIQPPDDSGRPVWQFKALVQLRDGHQNRHDVERQLRGDFDVEIAFVPDGSISGVVEAKMYLPITVGRA